MPIATSPSSSRFKRAALVLSAGLFATTLAIGGGLAANAAPSILNVTTATAYGTVAITANGFVPTESLTVNLDTTKLSDEVADGTGAFTGTAYIPDTTSLGVHTITVVGASTTQTADITIIAQPVAAPAAPTITVSAFGTTGVPVTFSGFTPGDTVEFAAGSAGMGGGVGTTVTVGTSGVVGYTLLASDIVSSGAVAPGEYYLSAFNATGSVRSVAATITVVADPAAPATPVKARAHFAG